MKNPNLPDGSQLESLVAAYLDGRIGDADWEILRQLLHGKREARDYFRTMTDLHAALLGDSLSAGEALASRDTERLEKAGKEVAVFASRRTVGVALAAAACLVLSLGTWSWQDAAGKVTLARVVGATFDGAAPAVGERLGGRDFQLNGGFVELRFPKCEASVLIEAPASFRVVDHETLWLERGRLTADVKNGNEQGLRVLTPDSDVLDLGTRFAVDVVEGRGSEVHVFEGEVIASQREGAPGDERSLVEGDAVRVALSGISNLNLRRATFVHGEELDRLATPRSSADFEALASAKARMKADPSLLAFLDFESADERSASTGHGVRWVQGRLPGTTAAEFLDPGDHLRLDLDAVTDQLTLMAWVRLDKTANGINSIYHTDKWGKRGQVHWMVQEDKQMRLALFGQSAAQESQWPESKRAIIEDLGRWVHLATVYDAKSATVRFFIDGSFDSEVALDVAPPAVLGPAQIGNWQIANSRFEDRRLSGRLDELVIVKRTMDADEIAAWVEAGSPY